MEFKLATRSSDWTASIPTNRERISSRYSSTVNIDRIKQLFAGNPDGDVLYHSTLQGAIDATTANAGDHIYIMLGHVESIDSTGDVNIDTAGITIEGLGQGDDMPLWISHLLLVRFKLLRVMLH